MLAGWGRWPRRRAGGWPATARSPGSWSPATPPPTTTTTTRPPIDPDHQDSPGGQGGLAALLQAAARRLPPALGGGPTQPLEVGRTTRVVTAAQRAALVVRDGGCAVAGCERPPAWCEAHHLRHWLHGGPTDLANLALVCRAHHRAVHEGGWRLTATPTGASPPPHRIENTPPRPEPAGGTRLSRGPAAAGGSRRAPARASTGPSPRRVHDPGAPWRAGSGRCRPSPRPPRRRPSPARTW